MWNGVEDRHGKLYSCEHVVTYVRTICLLAASVTKTCIEYHEGKLIASELDTCRWKSRPKNSRSPPKSRPMVNPLKNQQFVFFYNLNWIGQQKRCGFHLLISKPKQEKGCGLNYKKKCFWHQFWNQPVKSIETSPMDFNSVLKSVDSQESPTTQQEPPIPKKKQIIPQKNKIRSETSSYRRKQLPHRRRQTSHNKRTNYPTEEQKLPT